MGFARRLNSLQRSQFDARTKFPIAGKRLPYKEGEFSGAVRRRYGAVADGEGRYFVRPLHFWSQYLVSRVFRYLVPVCVWKNRVHGTVIS